jgi:hypothetical protein
MDTSNLLTKFARIGARAKLTDRPANIRRLATGVVRLDVQEDRDGEYFEVSQAPGAQPEVAAIPESAPVGTVRQAKEALKPLDVQVAQGRAGLRAQARNRRKNAAYRRQGEWFFLPVKGMAVDEKLVLKNEPITRGNRGKPHWLENCYRTGGETVYVCPQHRNGVTENVYHKIVTADPNARAWGWRTMRRNMTVYARGRVRHPDHRTIVLHGWHAVVMNTETQAKAMENMVFLD